MIKFFLRRAKVEIKEVCGECQDPPGAPFTENLSAELLWKS